MLVFHEPAGCAVQFRTNAGPDVLNWGEGMCALKAHQGHAMLYTEPFGPCHVGHFEALVQICPQDVLRACGAHSPPRPESDILPTMSGGVNSRVKQETASPSQKRRRVLKQVKQVSQRQGRAQEQGSAQVEVANSDAESSVPQIPAHRQGGARAQASCKVEETAGEAEDSVPRIAARLTSRGFTYVNAEEGHEEPLDGGVLLQAWAADTAKSKEPFPLTLRDVSKYGNQGRDILAAAVCDDLHCAHYPHCNFRAMVLLEKDQGRIHFVKKGGHKPDDYLTTAAEPRKTYKKRKVDEETWSRGMAVTWHATDISYKDVFDKISHWANTIGDNGHDKPFHVCSQERERKKDKDVMMRVESTCTSCMEDEHNKCTFFAETHLVKATGEFTIRYTGLHSPLGQRKSRGLMTPEQELAFHRSAANTAHGKRIAFVGVAGEAPELPQLSNKIHNDRSKSRVEDTHQTPADNVWPHELIKRCLADAAVPRVGAETLLLWKDIPGNIPSNAKDAFDMYLLDEGSWTATNGNPHIGFAFSSYACLAALSKLRNKEYIKLTGDGTFKRTFQNWCVIPVGLLTKREGRTRTRGQDAPIDSWPTHFTPLVWVLASGETTGSYKLGLAALNRMAAALFDIDLTRCTKQFHADLTPTAEAARQELYPASVRTADFWHLLEAIKEMLEEELEAGDEKRKHKNEIIHWIMATRSEPITFTEQHDLWALLFKHFREDLGEHRAFLRLQEKFFVLIPVERAKLAYNAEDLSMLQDGCAWCGLHWSGFCRLQPGSACGTEPTESYNLVFSKRFQKPDGRPLRKATPPQIFPALQKLIIA